MLMIEQNNYACVRTCNTHALTHRHTQHSLHSSIQTPWDLLKSLKGRWDFGPDPLDFILLKVFVRTHDALLLACACVGAPMLSRTWRPQDALLIRGKRGWLEWLLFGSPAQLDHKAGPAERERKARFQHRVRYMAKTARPSGARCEEDAIIADQINTKSGTSSY